LFPASGRQEPEIERELDAGRKIGIAVEKVVGLPFAGFSDAPVLRYANQATFHPLKYLRGLAAGIRARGGALYSDTVVEKVEERNSCVRVTTVSGFAVIAKSAVVATNSPINDRFALHTKQAPYRTYAMSFEIARGSVPDALYWDTQNPYHYLRLDLQHGRADMMRATFEGIALALRVALDELRRMTPLSGEMIMVGGGARSAAWRQMFADILGCAILKAAVDQQAATLGAAALAFVGIGAWPDFSPLRAICATRDTSAPAREASPVYEAALHAYRLAAGHQQQLAGALSELRERSR
jgi:hypothetical protein